MRMIKFKTTNEEVLSGQLLYKMIIFIHITNSETEIQGRQFAKKLRAKH